MKNIIFIALFLITTSLFSQVSKSNIAVNMQYMTNDTLSTFTIKNPQSTDQFIDNMLKYFGKPEKHEVGKIVWTNVNIPNIGKELTVRLVDCITFMDKNGDLIDAPFKNEKEKAEFLSTVNTGKEKKFRYVDVIICDANLVNIINTKREADIAEDLFEKIFKMK